MFDVSIRHVLVVSTISPHILSLADVSRGDVLSNSMCFTRGQELLAPSKVLFYTQDWSLYKGSLSSNHKEVMSC